MATKTTELFTELRKIDLKQWSLVMWLVKRRLTGGVAQYSVLRVDTEKKLQSKLLRNITDRLNGREYKVEEYSFRTADQDEQLFTINTDETDFKSIQVEIERGLKNGKAKKYSDLLNSWAYVIELKHEGASLFALRKINSMTKPKKVKAASSLLFQNQVLKDLNEEQVFTIDRGIDFIGYQGTLFITNKKEFESALNFRKGMEGNRDAVVSELDTLGIFHSVAPITKAVGSNLNMLRRISTVQKNGYYKNKNYMESMIKVCINEKWPLVVKDGKIEITDDTIDLVLTLLENGRLRSPINQELFDAHVKKKVG